MAVLKYGACIRVLTTTTGTGTYAVGNSPAGYLDPFASGMSSGDRSTWRCESEDSASWELFEGVLTAGSPSTISRARIIRTSSGGTTAISWPSGTKRITQVISPDRTAFLGTDGLLPAATIPSRSSLGTAAWSGVVALNTSPSLLAGVNTENATKVLDLDALVRLESSSPTAATVTITATVSNAADTAVETTLNLGFVTLHSEVARYATLRGFATYSPIGGGARAVRFYAAVDQNVTTMSIYEMRVKVRGDLLG